MRCRSMNERPSEEHRGPAQLLNRSRWRKPSLLILVTATSKVTPHLRERSNHHLSLHDASRTLSCNTHTLSSLSRIIPMYEPSPPDHTDGVIKSQSCTRTHPEPQRSDATDWSETHLTLSPGLLAGTENSLANGFSFSHIFIPPLLIFSFQVVNS